MTFYFFKIPIQIRLSFCILLLFFTDYYKNPSIENLVITLILVLGIFIHELGHAFTARYFNATPSVVLHCFGGTTTYNQSIEIKKQMLVILNGPLLQATLVIIPYFFLKLCPTSNDYTRFILNSSIRLNSIIILLNILPIFPLDGGQLLKYFLEFFWKDKGIKIALFISRFALLALTGLLLYYREFFFSIMLLVLLWRDQKHVALQIPERTTNRSVRKEEYIKVKYLPTKKMYFLAAALTLITFCLVPIVRDKKEARFAKSFMVHYEKHMENYSHFIVEMIKIKNDINSNILSINTLEEYFKNNIKKLQSKKALKKMRHEILCKEAAFFEKKQALEKIIQQTKDSKKELWEFKNDEFINTHQILEKYKESESRETSYKKLEDLESLLGPRSLIPAQQIISHLKIFADFLLEHHSSFLIQRGKIVFRQQKTQLEFIQIGEKLELLYDKLNEDSVALRKLFEEGPNDLHEA